MSDGELRARRSSDAGLYAHASCTKPRAALHRDPGLVHGPRACAPQRLQVNTPQLPSDALKLRLSCRRSPTVFALLQRYGGILLRPRTTIQSLAPGDGAIDGLVLVVLYGLGAKLEPLAHGVADFQASQGLSAVVALALGFVAYLPWVLTTLLVELTLGRDRTERTELCKVPLLVCAAGAGLADHLGATLPGPVYLPELLGAAWAVGIAAWVRADIVTDEQKTAVPMQQRARQLAGGVGLLFVALLAANATADVRYLSARWSTLAPLSTGEPITPFNVQLLEGGQLHSDELREGVHMLVFWTTWCGVCESEMPTLAELDRNFGERGLRITAVNSDSDGPARLGKVKKFRDRLQLPFQIALDHGALRKIFRVRAFPHIVLISDQQVRYMHQGRVLESTLAGEIETLLAPR